MLYAELSDILSVDKYIKIIQRGRDKSEIKQKPAQFLNRHNNYSIRKFTIGTASILVGTTLIFGLSNEAHAQSNSSAKVSDKVATEQSASTSQEADSSQQTAASNAQNVQTAPEQDKATPTTEVNSNNNQTDSKHVAPQKEQNQTATQTESKKKLHKHKQKQKKKQLLIAKSIRRFR